MRSGASGPGFNSPLFLREDSWLIELFVHCSYVLNVLVYDECFFLHFNTFKNNKKPLEDEEPCRGLWQGRIANQSHKNKNARLTQPRDHHLNRHINTLEYLTTTDLFSHQHQSCSILPILSCTHTHIPTHPHTHPYHSRVGNFWQFDFDIIQQ